MSQAKKIPAKRSPKTCDVCGERSRRICYDCGRYICDAHTDLEGMGSCWVCSAEHTRAYRKKPRGEPLDNPGEAPSRTEKLYNTWHKREPREEKRQRASIPENMHCVGTAKEILYSSNKWEKNLGTKHDYIHNFDSKPKVYCTKPLPGQARSNPTCQSRRLLGGHLEQVPLTQLGYVRELVAIVDGEEYVFPLSGNPMMCSTEDAKGVVILNKGGIIIVRGSQMRVEGRGIVK